MYFKTWKIMFIIFYVEIIPAYSSLILFSSLNPEAFVVLDKILPSLILKYFILLQTVYRDKFVLYFSASIVATFCFLVEIPSFSSVAKETIL